jgi:hypothetical protein
MPRDGEEIMLKNMDTIDLAARVIEIATGERYGDGETVRDLGIGYCSGGYGGADRVWATGNWNPKRFPRNDDPALTKHESMPVRLARVLELIGVECEWSDENDACAECHKLLCTQPDSYSWTLKGAFVDDEGYVCEECMLKYPESYLEGYASSSYHGFQNRALTWIDASELKALGFTQWEPSDPHTYESGWHPGQDDDPEKVFNAIMSECQGEDYRNQEVVFLVEGVGQFDMRWSAWVRDGEAY